MRALARALAALALVLAAGAALALAFGPREVVEGPGAFDAPALPDDLDAWLAAREAAVPDLRPGAEARIVWAGRTGERTPLSIVYLHGFSASPEEIRAIVSRISVRFVVKSLERIAAGTSGKRSATSSATRSTPGPQGTSLPLTPQAGQSPGRGSTKPQ